MPTCLSLVLRRCHRCASGCFRANGEFRVNPNHKPLDAWLLALCTGRGGTTKAAVLERMNVRSVRPEVLNLLYGSAPGPAAGLLQWPVVRRRDVGGSRRTGRPAWQSPYGPPRRRAHRGRWAPVPGVAWSPSDLRRGYLCDRCV
ncbi:DUF1062 domain-containing protein [Streptomyces sp. GbtcB6]|uniref:DUF1062 domain-containing protein n=1 Tax=Streptomyces sp. GbtcB6 TaxID=2824751 RepID=UPI0027E46369|nr:DUF1062 domain-containing protein [Streptomyces sp. GbtcB6]